MSILRHASIYLDNTWIRLEIADAVFNFVYYKTSRNKENTIIKVELRDILNDLDAIISLFVVVNKLRKNTECYNFLNFLTAMRCLET